jgi:hypothetical protein
MRNLKYILLPLVMLMSSSCNRNVYEVIERSDKQVPDYQGTGTHTEVDYVLLHDGHKIYAICDGDSIGSLDPNSTCGFRPLRTYECRLGQKGDKALSDLLCKDSDGFNVYLYVSKKE